MVRGLPSKVISPLKIPIEMIPEIERQLVGLKDAGNGEQHGLSGIGLRHRQASQLADAAHGIGREQGRLRGAPLEDGLIGRALRERSFALCNDISAPSRGARS